MESTAPVGVVRSRPSWGQLWFSLSGRASRFDYWVRFILVAAVLQVMAKTVDRQLGYSRDDLGLFEAFVALLLVWPTFAVCAKRAHDRGYSAWFLLWGPVLAGLIGAAIAGVGIAVLSFVNQSVPPPTVITPIVAGFAVGFSAFLWPFVELGLRPGTAGPNRYGPDPNAPSRSSPPGPPRARA